MMGNALTVALPFPPSVNTMFPTGRSGRRFVSPRYKAWKREAWAMIKQARIPQANGLVDIRIALTPKDNRPRDPDNFVKAVIDALVQNGVLVDDSSKHVRSVNVVMLSADQINARADVSISQAELVSR